LKGIPLLVLANKNDLEGAFTEEEVISKLQLEYIKDRKVVCYSVSAKSQNRMDVALKWLSEL
jgi:ADP-ribosylation factor-like protein 8